MTKRLLVILLVVFVSGFAGNSYASTKEAEEFVKKISKQAYDVIVAKGISEEQKEKKLDKMFLTYVNTDWIAKFVMGRYWNQASDEQKQKFSDLHEKILLKRYVPKFKEFNNHTPIVKGATQSDEDEYLVQTSIIPEKDVAYDIDYKIRQEEDGSFRVYDIIAEGISLINFQRSEISSILARQDIDYMIFRVAARADYYAQR